MRSRGGGAEALRGPRRTARLAGIEGLRGLAALGVLTWHVWAHPTNAAGYGVPLGPLTKVFDTSRIGVAMFFVLSGFLLYRPFAAAVVRGTRRPSIGSYFRNRALRILPAYWVVLLAVAVLFQDGLLERPAQLLANMTFLQDYVSGYVPSPFGGYGIGPAWSLCVEVVFYLVLPALGLLGLLLAELDVLDPVAAAFTPVALMWVGGIASLVAARATRLGGLWAMGFPVHAHWFGIGMAVGVVRVLWEDGRVRFGRLARVASAVGALALAALALKLAYAQSIDLNEEHSLLAVSCGVLLAFVVLPHPRSRLVRLLQWRPLFLLGLASYSVFLWHDPLLRALRDHGVTLAGRAGFAADLALVLALTLVASTITYRYVERPALALKQRRRGAATTAEDVATASAAP